MMEAGVVGGRGGHLSQRLLKVLIARVAQSVERSAVNRKVGGSNPPVSDIFLCTPTPQTPSYMPFQPSGII